ncbi:MAG: transcription antitermination factor NusB [Nannocystaceae bacterium]
MSRHRPSARASAVRVLRQIDQRRGFSNRILAEELARSGLDRRDRGFVTNLVYGALRHRARLDALIDRVARRPAGIRGKAREILRVAVYELRELEHPPHAAISEATGLIAGFDRGGGLVAAAQAILSTIAAEGEALDASLAEGKPLDVLAGRWSVPRWLAGRWLKRLGPERALARARALADVPSLDLRVDLGRIAAQEVAARLREDVGGVVEAAPGQPQALRVRGGGDLTQHPLFAAGLVSIQALGAQQPARALGPRPGERILDACAGMGTKTLQLAELMARRGTIVAADQSADRLAEHAELLARGELAAEALELSVVRGDLTGEVADVDDVERFDGVLLDAPCTGLGNLARHPELRWTREFADIAACAALQRRLLDACWGRVRPGGRLVYAVCSLEPEEGEALVHSFVAERGLRVAEEATWSPEDDACDGFYLARIEA